MNAFDLVSDPVRRRILELLAVSDRTAGEVTDIVRDEFGISQPAVSNQLRILRESGVATATRQGSRQLYAVVPEGMGELDAWVQKYRALWSQRLDALDVEILRGRRNEDDDVTD